jgi:tRNA pseudouridine65 synthase
MPPTGPPNRARLRASPPRSENRGEKRDGPGFIRLVASVTKRPHLPVLAETDDWIVVAKPPRMLVHRNAFQPRAEACLQWVRDQVGSHVYPIHRLDFQTSGCLLFAKQQSWAAPLQKSLTNGRKTYIAFVRGYFAYDKAVLVETPMKNDKGILKEAESTVEFIGRSHEPRCSLLRVFPKTGRFHQVRRHVRDLHHPCIGDSEHGDSKLNRWWRENSAATRLGLHCLHMVLPLPGGETLSVSSPLFEDQYEVFSSMPWWEEVLEKEPTLGLKPLVIPIFEPEEPEEPELSQPSE